MIRELLKRAIPSRYHEVVHGSVRYWGSFLYLGNRYACSVCKGKFRTLKSFGIDTDASRKYNMVGMGRRDQSACPRCNSRERERALALYLEHKSRFFEEHPRRVLHIAPERGLGRVL